MSGVINNGGPAFPAEVCSLQPDGRQVGNTVWQTYGMSLRDYFAAKALQAVPMQQSRLHDIQPTYDRIAQHAYKMADAMLRARAIGSDTPAASTRESGKEEA